VRAIWQYGLSAFRDWASWRKLEPSLRAAIANRDVDMAVCYCDRYRMAAVTPVIKSIIQEMRASTGVSVPQLARIRRAWRGASKAQLSKLTRPIRFLQTAAFVLPLTALSAIALDAAQSFQDPHFLASVEAPVASDLPFLIVALSISVVAFLLQKNMELRARILERVIDDLATDLIISFLENGEKAATKAYQPGKWIRFDEIQAATPGPGPRG
jgi:hypothetical protein